MTLYLRDDFQAALRSGALASAGVADAPVAEADTFNALFRVAGEIYRQARGRRTLRFVAAGSAYFAKLHSGVGWREIGKNLVSLKWPVVSARNEFDACRRLRANGVRAPSVAAFGARGGNPATRRSFVICDALEGFVSLEALAGDWSSTPPSLKHRLLAAVGELTRAMHDAGVSHRDYYACHVLADAARLAEGGVELAVIDLHRARVRRRTRARWRRRDLAALLYSVAALPLSRQDRGRFIAAYAGERAAAAMRRQRLFWRAVSERAERLAERAAAKGVATGVDMSATTATVADFAELGRKPALPFRFDLDIGGGAVRAVCVATLRSQPGRRYVGRVIVDGREMIVKAFFGRRGRRDFLRERRGVAALHDAGVASPRLLGAGKGAGARLLAFEAIAGRVPSAVESEPLFAALARMHERGVRQQDLHLDNFLVRDGKVYAVDGGRVRRGRVRRAARLRDIATLLAQFTPGEAPGSAAAAQCYAGASEGRFSPRQLRRLPRLAAAARRRRVAQYIAKTVRDCTAFEVRRDRRRLTAVARGDDDPVLLAAIADPEAALASAVSVKQGNTATVKQQGGLVIKRYNVKNRGHGWRLRLRASRARRAWRAGHGLRFAGCATPRPRAFIECGRAKPGSAAAYLILDRVSGVPLADVTDDGLCPGLEAKTRDMFARWRDVRFSHGDTKADNFIVADDALHVLDLDSAVFHRLAWRFARRHRRDRARFVRNWQGDSPGGKGIGVRCGGS